MSTELATINGNFSLPSAVEAALVYGDTSKLTPELKNCYLKSVSDSLGLNWLTQPLGFIKTDDGREIPYVKKDATEQLRKIHKISLTIISRERVSDVYVVTARATTPDGRSDESTGAVWLKKYKTEWDNNARKSKRVYKDGNPVIEDLPGDALANALMKAETKAKRRVTLSICGLGWLDESEMDTIPGASVVELPVASASLTPSLNQGAVRPAVTEDDLAAIHETFGTDNPWLHCIASERSPSRGKALFELPETAWQKIHENPAKALSHFCEADQAAIYACMANPELRPE